MDEILEKQENHISEESRPLTKVLMLENAENLLDHCIEVLVSLEDIVNAQSLELRV